MKKTAVLCGLMAIYALYLRVEALWLRDLWNDELYQFLCMNQVIPFWLRYTYGDHTCFPGGYLINYPFIVLFGHNKWGLAIPHIISTVLGLFLLYQLCRIYFKTVFGYAIAFLLVAWNSNLIFHSLEFRPYAVLPTLALGSLYFAEMLAREYDRMSLGKRIAIGFFYVFVAIYHAYGILILFLPAMFVLLIRWQKQARLPIRFFQFFLIVAAIALPLWFWYASYNLFHLKIEGQAAQSITNTFQYIPDPVSNTVGFLKGIVGNLIGTRKLYVVLLGILAAMLIPHNRKYEQLIFLGILIVLPITVILFVDIKSQYWFIQRQFIWVMPLFAIWLAWCWDVSVDWAMAYLRKTPV